jgi:methyl-accepting chemotaxis protein
MVSGLSEGSVQVASASGQLSSASQGLAQGASEQAASIEETALALEEMSSMTRQNADHAKTANTLAISACNAAEEGDKAMNEMLTAMKSINDSSTRISKIIKVIEEIAFQTNLLALNASVEAARAGDTGKGFAVVADEVRNLAQRASSAAQDTTALIEDSVGRTTKGQELANKSTDTLKNILVNVKKVADLIGEISAATQEQAQGIEQVNTAVGQMDIVTQQNVSNAEETASASEELSAQALNLQDLVRDIVVFVRGASDCMSPDRDVENKSAPQNPEREAVENSRWTNNNKGKHNDENGNNGLNRTGKESNGGSSRNAEELIRLNEDFKGF